jgi:RHS repeat-associated protein
MNQYTYLPFGEAQSTSETVTNRIRYTGRELESESGLYYNNARWYDPALHRFISEDPIGLGGGINQYAYTANDPVNYTDASGLDPCLEGFFGGSPQQGQWEFRHDHQDWVGSAIGDYWILCPKDQSRQQPRQGDRTFSERTIRLGGGGSGAREWTHCVWEEARQNWDETNSGLDEIGGATGTAAKAVFDLGIKPRVLSSALETSGVETAGSLRLLGRWVLWKSARFDDPIMVAGSTVGQGAGGEILSTRMAAYGVGINLLEAVGVWGSWQVGKAIGSSIWGTFVCSL